MKKILCSAFFQCVARSSIPNSFFTRHCHCQCSPPIILSFPLFPHFNLYKFMYATNLFRLFAVVHGGDATQALAPSTPNNNKCFKIAAFTRPTSHNGVNLKSGKALRPCRCSADSNSDVFSVTSSNKSDVDYLGESTKGDLNVKSEHLEAFGNT